MASVNKVIIVGNLGKDPEVRYAQNGEAFCTISVATTDSWKDKNTGEKKEATEWHRITFNGQLAEIVGQYLKKGRPVYVEGTLRTRKWDDHGTERYVTEIRALTMQMLGGRDEQSGGRSSRSAPASSNYAAPKYDSPQSAGSPGGFADFPDDIPF